MVPWHNKVLWLLHQYRQAYDLRDAGQSNIADDARGQQIVAAIRAGDMLAFGEAKQIFTNAPITARRLRRYNGVDSTVLRPPLNDPELFGGGEAEGYVLANGRINAGKRQYLLVEALRHAPRHPPPSRGAAGHAGGWRAAAPPCRDCGSGGPSDAGPALPAARRLRPAGQPRLGGRLFAFRREFVRLLHMEAFQAGKPVLTTTDFGGVLDIVRDGETGLVATPDPEALGAALATLADQPERAGRLGRAGREALEVHELNWPATIGNCCRDRLADRLGDALECQFRHRASRLGGRRRIGPAWPRDHGAPDRDGRCAVAAAASVALARARARRHPLGPYPPRVRRRGGACRGQLRLPWCVDPRLRELGVVGIFHDAFLANLAAGWAYLPGGVGEQALRFAVREAHGEDGWRADEPFITAATMLEVARRRPMLEWLAPIRSLQLLTPITMPPDCGPSAPARSK